MSSVAGKRTRTSTP